MSYERIREELFKVLVPDIVIFAEDMSYKAGPMLSPELYDEFISPYYAKILPFLKEHGCIPMVDSDGDKYKNVYSGSGTTNGKQHYSFHPEKGKMPSGARLLIKLITGQREIKVPFGGKNLKVGPAR